MVALPSILAKTDGTTIEKEIEYALSPCMKGSFETWHINGTITTFLSWSSIIMWKQLQTLDNICFSSKMWPF